MPTDFDRADNLHRTPLVTPTKPDYAHNPRRIMLGY